MKITPLFGVVGLALCAACGGGSDDGGGDPGNTRIESNNPIHIIESNNPIHIIEGNNPIPIEIFGNNPIPIIIDSYAGANPLYAVRDNDLLAARYEYVLHGSDAELDAWLVKGDLVMERQPAGGLTYAVVRTSSPRDVPASLSP